MCGRVNRAQSAFCIHCGARLSGKKVTHPYETGRLPPHVLLKDRYLILQKIAQGGMSAVYLATDTQNPGSKWAVKEMSFTPLAYLTPQKRQEMRERLEECFQREFEILHKANHPNLPVAQDYFVVMDRPYIVMEFIDGKTLEQILESNQENTFLEQERVLEWARQLCDVLDYLHSQTPPIIYRDLKPSNVMEFTNTRTIKLIDFGIARFYKPGKHSDTVRFGTDGYLAPEVLGNVDQTSPATDIYSLGAMLHQLLTNRDPALTPFQFPSLRLINPAVTPQVEKAVLKAVQAQTMQRPQSAEAMLKELFGPKSKFVRKPAQPAAAPPPYTPSKPAPQPLPQAGQPVPVYQPAWAYQQPSVPPSQAAPPARATPSAPSARQVTLSTRSIYLGKTSRGRLVSPGMLMVTAPAPISVSVLPDANWLTITPQNFTGTGQPVMVTIGASTKQLGFGSLSIKGKKSFFSILVAPIRWYLNAHLHLVPATQKHAGEFFVYTPGSTPIPIQVEVEIKPPGGLVFIGWLAMFILILLELGFITVAVLFGLQLAGIIDLF